MFLGRFQKLNTDPGVSCWAIKKRIHLTCASISGNGHETPFQRRGMGIAVPFSLCSVFTVARFKIGHTPRKNPHRCVATSRFNAYLVQSRFIIIHQRRAHCKAFFKVFWAKKRFFTLPFAPVGEFSPTFVRRVLFGALQPPWRRFQRMSMKTTAQNRPKRARMCQAFITVRRKPPGCTPPASTRCRSRLARRMNSPT